MARRKGRESREKRGRRRRLWGSCMTKQTALLLSLLPSPMAFGAFLLRSSSFIFRTYNTTSSFTNAVTLKTPRLLRVKEEEERDRLELVPAWEIHSHTLTLARS